MLLPLARHGPFEFAVLRAHRPVGPRPAAVIDVAPLAPQVLHRPQAAAQVERHAPDHDRYGQLGLVHHGILRMALSGSTPGKRTVKLPLLGIRFSPKSRMKSAGSPTLV